jgi:predicted Fe-Mo cluster-binding NifX family protein
MIVAIPVTENAITAPGWGRARRVAVATSSDVAVADRREYEVGWDVAHDEGIDGAHEARVAHFLIDHLVEVVVADHMGAGMSCMLATMGIRTAHGAHGAHGDPRADANSSADIPPIPPRSITPATLTLGALVNLIGLTSATSRCPEALVQQLDHWDTAIAEGQARGLILD